jgi:glycerophosphoryl diester phosphodiesterase
MMGVFFNIYDADKAKNLLESDEFIVVGHRGASVYAPEHTLPAYRLAMDMEADFIEIDLQMTKDGHLIAMHDDAVDRTTEATGSTTDLNLSEIKKLDAGSWFNEAYPSKSKKSYENVHVPTLDEILEEFGDEANFYIETKNTGMEAELIKLLERHHLLDKDKPEGRVIIQSFSEESLQTLHGMDKRIPLVKLVNEKEILQMTPETLEKISAYSIGLGAPYKAVDQLFIQEARNAGLLVHLFTVNEKKDAEQVKSWGATGIFTDDLKAMEELNR